MKKLCLGTYFTIFKRCKLKSCTQKQIVGTIMQAFDSRFDESDDSMISNLVLGRKNPPNYIVESAASYLKDDYQGLVEYFESKVLVLIDQNKADLLKEALISVIEMDDTISDDCVIDIISDTKKSEIREKELDMAVLSAGIMLYVLKATDNNESNQYVKELNDRFFNRLKKNSLPTKGKQKRHNKGSAELVYREAQEFCINHEDEILLLPLCQIAAFVDPLHRHVREMYTDYCKCTKDTRELILKLKGVSRLDFSDEGWIAKSLDLFDNEIKEKKLSTISFLYDGAKYFHRAYERYAKSPVEFDPYIFEGLILKGVKCSLSTRIGDYLELTKNKSKRTLTPPIDEVWTYCQDISVPEEQVTYWVCMIIIATCFWLYENKDVAEEEAENDFGDASMLISTQEDMYFYSLLELYKLFKVK